LAARWVLFDVGGVLIEWDDSIIFRTVAERYELDVRAVMRVLTSLRRELQSNRISLHEFWTRFGESFAVPTPKDWRSMWVSQMIRFARPRKDLLALAEGLRRHGVRTGLFSNTDRSHWRYFRSTGWFTAFSPQIVSFRIGAVKPDPKAFRGAKQSFPRGWGIPLFVDDSDANVSAAAAAGWDAVRFSSLSGLKKELRKRQLLNDH